MAANRAVFVISSFPVVSSYVSDFKEKTISKEKQIVNTHNAFVPEQGEKQTSNKPATRRSRRRHCEQTRQIVSAQVQ